MPALKKYQVCESCKQNLWRNVQYFRRIRIPGTYKETYSTMCRNCEAKDSYNRNWKGDKLICHCCKEAKPIEEFDISTNNIIRRGRDNRCKKCKNQQARERKNHYSEDQKLYKLLQERFYAARDRAKKKNLQFDLTLKFLLELWDKQNGLCAISGIPMTCTFNQGRIFTNVSIDKIDPKGGYTQDNVQLVCQAINQLKSDWTMETVLYICKQVIDTQNARRWNHG